MMPFQEFPKIPRWSRRIIVTEKIDGTNGVVCVMPDGKVFAGSKSQWIFPGETDNFGFARWVSEHSEELSKLGPQVDTEGNVIGPGLHHGEWWGQGINRGYGLKEKRFSLLNTSKWREANIQYRFETREKISEPKLAPACCHVVPVLYDGNMNEYAIQKCLQDLKLGGSQAAIGFFKPEGVVIYHVQGNLFFKKTIEHDEIPKSIVGVSQ